MKKLLCFGANRVCHHHDYYLLIESLLINDDVQVEYVKSWKSKLRWLLSKESIVYLDIDKYDLIFVPLMIFRSFYAKRSFGISVRTERLLISQVFSLYDFVVLFTKQSLFLCLKLVSNTTIISTHKDQRGLSLLTKYVGEFVYDIQYWDLDYMQIERRRPSHPILEKIDLTNIILIPGRFNRQKSVKEFLCALDSNSDQNFLIAGKVDGEVLDLLIERDNIYIIDEYLPNEELLYLIEKSRFIYCYYPLEFDRPSGFFGRTIQFNNIALVRANSYLSKEFNYMPNVVSLASLFSMRSQIHNMDKSLKEEFRLDSSKQLKSIFLDV